MQQQHEVHTEVRVAIDALDHEYNHDARTQSPRLSAPRLHKLSVDAGSDLETKKSGDQAHVFRGYVSYESTHSSSSSRSSCWARMLG